MPLGEMLDMIDRWGESFQVDAALRVVTRFGEGYIDGNVHTHHGRFGVWYPERKDGTATSLAEVESMTDEAACWIAGFLAGNEPDLMEYLGLQRSPADLEPEVTEAEVERWREFLAEFRRTGYLPHGLNQRPLTPLVLTESERAEMRSPGPVQPWAFAGGRVWLPDGATWVEADPQPALVNGQLPGTICADRGHPELMGLQSGWSICLDCAEVHAEY